MAIHNNYPGLKVEIVVGGKALKEHEERKIMLRPNTVERYIEAEAGTEFAIKYSFDQSFSHDKDVSMTVFADGRIVKKPIHSETKLSSGLSETIGEAVRYFNGRWQQQTLRFSELSITEHDVAVPPTTIVNSVAHVGEIVVKLWLGERGGRCDPAKVRNWRHENLTERGTVPESAMKGEAKSLRLGLGPKRAAQAPTTYVFNYDPGKFIAVYKFKYRSRANLEAMHIVPREQPPTPAQFSEPLAEFAHPCSTGANSPIQNTPTSGHQQTPDLLVDENTGDLTQAELIRLIKHYRGNDHGLANQSLQRLKLLLKFYEDEEIQVAPAKSEPPLQETGGTRVKRENNGIADSTRSRKRKKADVVILDD